MCVDLDLKDIVKVKFIKRRKYEPSDIVNIKMVDNGLNEKHIHNLKELGSSRIDDSNTYNSHTDSFYIEINKYNKRYGNIGYNDPIKAFIREERIKKLL